MLGGIRYMSIKYRVFNKKSSFSLLHPILFVFIILSLFPVADRAYGQIQDVGCTAGTSLKEKGCWKEVFHSGPIVHATVLPNGHLLYWSSNPPTAGPYTRLWNCNLAGDADKKLCQLSTSPTDIFFTDPNIYCSGHSMMSDGKVMITGGSHQDIAVFAELRTTTFDYTKVGTGQTPWKTDPDVPKMAKGRWYPTNVALGDGGTLVASGLYRYQGAFLVNDIPEILASPTASQWTELTDAGAGCDTIPEDPGCITLPLYPWLYYASNGKVFYAGPTQQARWLSISGTGAWLPLNDSNTPAPPPSSTYRESGSSVMYGVDKVMVSGGGPVSPVATNEVIDLTPSPSPSPTPAWRTVAPMAFARKHHNLTILADGKILATGGTKGTGFNNNCERQVVYEAEMWTPSTGPSDPGTWSTMAKMAYNRRYHSTAVLLRDGRVMVGGSDLYPSTPTQCSPPLQYVWKTEIFTPGTDVFMITITTDPETDTPERLKAWSKKYNPAPDWTLVTGSVENITRLLQVFTGDGVSTGYHVPAVCLVNDVKKSQNWTYGLAPIEDLLKMVDGM